MYLDLKNALKIRKNKKIKYLTNIFFFYIIYKKVTERANYE